MSDITIQSRNSSVIFWIGLISCVYEAILNSINSSLSAAGMQLHPIAGCVLNAIGVALAAVLIYCNGNNPSIKNRY